MKTKLTLVNNYENWDAKRRYKINSTVSYNGNNWQNITGINSEPGTDNNWLNTNSNQPKYKVFTALLTQSGEGVNSSLSNEPLTIGVTYMIDDNGGSGWDFTNVGAPNNEVGTYFIATGTTPNNWGGPNGNLYYNLGSPVATILENTIGNVWFSYSSNGIYNIRANEANPLFTFGKTALLNQTKPNDDVTISMLMFYVEEFQINIETFSNDIKTDGLLYSPTTIEIRVYN